MTGISHNTRFDLAEKNYSKIWIELADFVGFPVPEKWTGDMTMKTYQPVIYAKQPALKSRCLEWLAEKSGFPQFFGDVKPIEELIWMLRMKYLNPIQTSHVQDFFQRITTQYYQFCFPPPNMDRAALSAMQKLFIDTRCDYHKKLFTTDSSSARLSCALSGVRTIFFVLRKVLEEQATTPS